MLPHPARQSDLRASVGRWAGEGSIGTVAVVVEHGAKGRADGETTSLDKGQWYMARVVGLGPVEDRKGPRLEA